VNCICQTKTKSIGKAHLQVETVWPMA